MLSPADVTADDDRVVWWQCPAGHEYEASIKARVKGAGCPTCQPK